MWDSPRSWTPSPCHPRPKGLAIAADGTRLYVTHFLSGMVSVLDLTDRSVRAVIATGPESNMAQRIVLHPMNNRAYLPHIRSNTSNPHPLFDTTLFPVISVIDLATEQHLLTDRLELSVVDRPVNLPFDLAFSSDGQRAHIVYLGSGDMSVIDLASRQKYWPIWRSGMGRGVLCSPRMTAPPMWPTPSRTMCR